MYSHFSTHTLQFLYGSHVFTWSTTSPSLNENLSPPCQACPARLFKEVVGSAPKTACLACPPGSGVQRESESVCVWRAYHPRPRALPSPPACILMFTLYGRAHCYWYIVNIRIHAGCVCSHYVSRRVCVRWIGERECVCVCLCACMCACLFVTQDSCLACPPGFYSNFLHATTAAVCVRVGWERKRERARARESVCVCICVTQDQMPCLFPWLLFEFSKKIIQLQ